jgi:hypothetical protein
VSAHHLRRGAVLEPRLSLAALPVQGYRRELDVLSVQPRAEPPRLVQQLSAEADGRAERDGTLQYAAVRSRVLREMYSNG